MVKWLNKPVEMYRCGMAFNSNIAKVNTRTPGGHPEGYLEAFGNIYRNFTRTLLAKMNGESVDGSLIEFPTVKDSICGMAFIEKVVRSHESNEKWTGFEVKSNSLVNENSHSKV